MAKPGMWHSGRGDMSHLFCTGYPGELLVGHEVLPGKPLARGLDIDPPPWVSVLVVLGCRIDLRGRNEGGAGVFISFPHPFDAREATATLTGVSLATSAFVHCMSSSSRLNLIRSPTARSEYVFLVFDRPSFGTSRGETPLAI